MGLYLATRAPPQQPTAKSHQNPTMRISHIVTCIALAISSAHAVSVPNSIAVDVRDERAVSVSSSDLLAPENALEKRKGGGGKGGGGGSSSGSSSK